MRWFLALLLVVPAIGQSIADSITTIPVTSAFTGLTHVTSARDGSGRLFVVEQQGVVRILRNGSLSSTPFLDIRSKVLSGGERGLLSIAFPPNYASSGRFYVNYTNRPNGATVVARYKVSSNADQADPASEQVLFTVAQPYENHNGGMLAFNPRDGLLYIGMGDGGSAGDPQNNAQNSASLLGKMLRFNAESVPNAPIQGDFIDTIYSGLRNPWRFSFDRETGDLWIGDVGQDKYEEVDFLASADTGSKYNFGWRRMEGAHCFENNCNTTSLTLPVFEYDHGSGCSITGGYVYRGSRWPALRGYYIFADYCSGNAWAMRGPSDQFRVTPLKKFPTNITSFGEDEGGEIYMTTTDGRVLMMSGGAPVTPVAGVVNAASYQPGLVPGSIASIFGSGLTSITGVMTASSFPIPTTLANTSVTLDNIKAPILAVANVSGQEQINIQVPFELAGKNSASLVVTNNGIAGTAATVPITSSQPGLFAVTRTGRNITLWATGLGAVDSTPATGAASGANALRSTVRVFLNFDEAQITYAGLAPGYAGLYQVNARVPDSFTSSTASVHLESNSASSNTVQVRLN